MQNPILRALAPLLACVALAVPLAVYAKNGTVVVSADEKVEGDLIRAGQTVRILASVDGDVIVAGGTVEVAGPVTGDVIAAGGDVRITADVGGSVRAAGGSVEISGSVGRSVLAAGRRVVIGETAEIGWSVTVAASDFVFSGRAGRDVRAWTDQALMAGEAGGDLTLVASAQDGVTLERTAIVQGDFEYTAPGPVALRDGAVVKGKTTPHQLPESNRRVAAVGAALGRLIKICGLIAVGLLLLSVVPKAVDTLTQEAHFWTWRNFGEGFLWLALTPIAAVILLVTVIGMPLAFILIAGWAVIIYLAQVVAALFLGRALAVHVFKHADTHPRFIHLVFGALLWVIVTSIPWLGWMLCLAGILFGMGSLAAFKRQELARYR